MPGCSATARRRRRFSGRAEHVEFLSFRLYPVKTESRAAYDARLAGEVRGVRPQAVALAGFMRVLSSAFLDVFPDRVINIHPALLPAFRGLDAQEQAVAAGVRFSGCTVHFVDGGMDTGPIILQSVVPVYQEDTGGHPGRPHPGQGAQDLPGRPPASGGRAAADPGRAGVDRLEWPPAAVAGRQRIGVAGDQGFRTGYRVENNDQEV